MRDKAGATEFLGYDTEKAEGIVAALVRDGEVVESAGEGEAVGVVVNQTPFYGESGGQMGDTGTISGEGFRIEVTDTQKKARRALRAFGQRRQGHGEDRRGGRARGRPCAPHAAALQPLGDAPRP